VLVAGGGQVSAGALLGAFLRDGYALAQGARNLARCHGVGPAACVVVDAIDRTCKFNGGLPKQCGKAHVGMSPINHR
jgi:hypothetical protein